MRQRTEYMPGSFPTLERPGSHTVYGVPQARYGRTLVAEADRDAVIEVVKRAFVRDELSIEQLANRVGVAHVATRLDELDGLIADLESTDAE